MVGANSFYNVLWRNDCYLNPNRPQPGTWQYSRAGWCPGARVDAWMVDITGLVSPGHSVALNYIADPYTNTSIDAGNPARHWVASQLITYRPGPTNAPALGVGLTASGLTLSWPSWAHRHELYSASAMGTNAGLWSRVLQTPQVISNAFIVHLPLTPKVAFYRLQTVAVP